KPCGWKGGSWISLRCEPRLTRSSGTPPRISPRESLRTVSTRTHVNMLTHEQIAFYHAQGYLVVPNLLSLAELEELREATRSFEEEAAILDMSDHRFVLEPDQLEGRSLIYRVVDPILHHPTYEK